jgi:hypothetical protein
MAMFQHWESTMSDVGEQYTVVIVLASGITPWSQAVLLADSNAVVPILSERVAQAYL